MLYKKTGSIICAERKDTVFIQDDAETAVRSAVIMHEGTELILEYRLTAVSCNHIHPTFMIFSFPVYLN